MNQLNSIILEGNFENGNRKDNSYIFSIAVNRMYKDCSGKNQVETSFFDVECWGQLADMCERKLEKGCEITALSAIGQPEQFYAFLEKDYKIKEKITFDKLRITLYNI